MASVNDAIADLYGGGEQMHSQSKNRRMTQHSRKWSSSGLGLDAAEAEARRLEKKGTFSATMDDEAGTVTLSKDDFKAVMGKLGGHKQVAKRSQSNLILLAFGYLAVSVGFIAVIVGLMNWRLEATKESHVTSGALVSKDGEAVQTATLLSFTSIYDLTKLDVKTILSTKEVTLQLEADKTMSFIVTGATKRAGSLIVKLLTPGGVIMIDGKRMSASATVNNQCYKVRQPTSEQRRMLKETRKLVHSSRELVEAMPGGSVGLSIAAGKAIQDLIDKNQIVSGSTTMRMKDGDDIIEMSVVFMANARANGEAYDTECRMRQEIVNEPGNFAIFASSVHPISADAFHQKPGNFSGLTSPAKVAIYGDQNGGAYGAIVDGDFVKSKCLQARGGTHIVDSSAATETGTSLADFIGPNWLATDAAGNAYPVFKDAEFRIIRPPIAVAQCLDNQPPEVYKAASRRLAEVHKGETYEHVTAADHFEHFYHRHIRSEHAKHVKEGRKVPRHLQEKKDMADLIGESYGMYKNGRRLENIGTAADKANGVYNSNCPSGFGSKRAGGYFCHKKSGNTCWYLFKGTAPTSMKDVTADITGVFSGRTNWGSNSGFSGNMVHYADDRYMSDSGVTSDLEKSGCTNKYFIGHSLGGAMAAMFADRYGGNNGNTRVYTYGGLRNGDNRYRHWGGTRLYHDDDPASGTICAMQDGWGHIGWKTEKISDHSKWWHWNSDWKRTDAGTYDSARGVWPARVGKWELGGASFFTGGGAFLGCWGQALYELGGGAHGMGKYAAWAKAQKNKGYTSRLSPGR